MEDLVHLPTHPHVIILESDEQKKGFCPAGYCKLIGWHFWVYLSIIVRDESYIKAQSLLHLDMILDLSINISRTISWMILSHLKASIVPRGHITISLIFKLIQIARRTIGGSCWKSEPFDVSNRLIGKHLPYYIPKSYKL